MLTWPTRQSRRRLLQLAIFYGRAHAPIPLDWIRTLRMLLLFFQAVLSGAVGRPGALGEKTGISTLFTPTGSWISTLATGCSQLSLCSPRRRAHKLPRSKSIHHEEVLARKKRRYTTQGDAFQHQPASLMTTPNKASDTARVCACDISRLASHKRVALTGHGNKKLAARKN